MAYCVYTDLEAMVGVPTMAQLTNDTAASSTTDQAVAAAMIKQADTLIDAKAGQVYTVPFTTVPDLIFFISKTLALYFCFLRRFSLTEVPKGWIAQKDIALQNLDDISNMMLWLPDTATVASTEGDFVPRTDNPVVDFNDDSNPISEF